MNAEAALLAKLDAKGFVPLPVNIDAFPKKDRWQERIAKKPVLALPAPVKSPPHPVENPVQIAAPKRTSFEAVLTLRPATDDDLDQQDRSMTCFRIGIAVAAECKISLTDIRSPRRFQPITRARFIACYLCRKLTRHSYPAIGEWMKRDHTSILHAFRTVDANITAFDPELSAVMRRLGVLA